MKLAKFEWRQYSLYFKSRFSNSQGSVNRRTGLILRGETSDGLIGFGEIAPLEGFSRESLSDVTTSLEKISAILKDNPLPTKFDDLKDQLLHLRHHAGSYPSLQFGVETLLADLASQAAGIPLSRWLNQHATTAIPVNAVLAEKNNGIEQRITEKLNAGFKTIKVKIGIERPLLELEKIAKLRELAGDSISIRLDANQAFTFEDASLLLSSAAKFDIEYVEEPLRLDEIHHLRELREKCGIPVALDESLSQILSSDNSEDVLRSLVEGVGRQSLDVAIIKPMLLGGFSTCIPFSDHLHRRGIKTVVTSSLDSPIAVTAALHLAAALGEQVKPCGFDTIDLFREIFTSAPPSIKNGTMQVPMIPGLGIGVVDFHNNPLLS